MAEMWGIAGGHRNFIHDQMKMAELALNERQLNENVSYRRDALALQQREFEAQQKKLADAAAGEAETRELLAQAAAGFNTEEAAGRIGAYNAGAAALLSRGRADEAVKLSNTAAQELQRLESAAAAASRQRKQDFDLEMAKTAKLEELFTGVKSQADFDRVRLLAAQMPELADELDSPLFKQYDPKLVQSFVAGTKPYMERRKLEMQQEEDRSQKALRDARIADMDARRDYQERVLAFRKEREGSDAKAGKISPARGATKGDLATTQTLLKQKGFLLPDEELDAGVQVRSITDDAITLMRLNPGIRSQTEAIEIAIEDAKRRGEIIPAQPVRFGIDKPARFDRKEGSIARPLDIPSDPRKIQPNFNYRHPNGGVARWDGSKWIPVTAPPGSPGIAQTSRVDAAANPFRDLDDDDEGEE